MASLEWEEHWARVDFSGRGDLALRCLCDLNFLLLSGPQFPRLWTQTYLWWSLSLRACEDQWPHEVWVWQTQICVTLRNRAWGRRKNSLAWLLTSVFLPTLRRLWVPSPLLRCCLKTSPGFLAFRLRAHLFSDVSSHPIFQSPGSIKLSIVANHTPDASC